MRDWRGLPGDWRSYNNLSQGPRIRRGLHNVSPSYVNSLNLASGLGGAGFYRIPPPPPDLSVPGVAAARNAATGVPSPLQEGTRVGSAEGTVGRSYVPPVSPVAAPVAPAAAPAQWDRTAGNWWSNGQGQFMPPGWNGFQSNQFPIAPTSTTSPEVGFQSNQYPGGYADVGFQSNQFPGGTAGGVSTAPTPPPDQSFPTPNTGVSPRPAFSARKGGNMSYIERLARSSGPRRVAKGY